MAEPQHIRELEQAMLDYMLQFEENYQALGGLLRAGFGGEIQPDTKNKLTWAQAVHFAEEEDYQELLSLFANRLVGTIIPEKDAIGFEKELWFLHIIQPCRGDEIRVRQIEERLELLHSNIQDMKAGPRKSTLQELHKKLAGPVRKLKQDKELPTILEEFLEVHEAENFTRQVRSFRPMDLPNPLIQIWLDYENQALHPPVAVPHGMTTPMRHTTPQPPHRVAQTIPMDLEPVAHLKPSSATKRASAPLPHPDSDSDDEVIREPVQRAPVAKTVPVTKSAPVPVGTTTPTKPKVQATSTTAKVQPVQVPAGRPQTAPVKHQTATPVVKQTVSVPAPPTTSAGAIGVTRNIHSLREKTIAEFIAERKNKLSSQSVVHEAGKLKQSADKVLKQGVDPLDAALNGKPTTTTTTTTTTASKTQPQKPVPQPPAPAPAQQKTETRKRTAAAPAPAVVAKGAKKVKPAPMEHDDDGFGDEEFASELNHAAME